MRQFIGKIIGTYLEISIKNIPSKCILASVIVSVWKRIFRPLSSLCDIWIQREWIWIGWEQIWERKRKNYLLTMTRIIKQPHNTGKFYFCTRKHIEVRLNFSHAAGPKMLCLCFGVCYMAPIWFHLFYIRLLLSCLFFTAMYVDYLTFSHLNPITNSTPLPNATLTIGATARNPNYRGSRVYPNYRGSCTQP